MNRASRAANSLSAAPLTRRPSAESSGGSSSACAQPGSPVRRLAFSSERTFSASRPAAAVAAGRHLTLASCNREQTRASAAAEKARNHCCCCPASGRLSERTQASKRAGQRASERASDRTGEQDRERESQRERERQREREEQLAWGHKPLARAAQYPPLNIYIPRHKGQFCIRPRPATNTSVPSSSPTKSRRISQKNLH